MEKKKRKKKLRPQKIKKIYSAKMCLGRKKNKDKY